MDNFKMKLFRIFYIFVFFQYCFSFTVDRYETVISYDVTEISKCRTGRESLGPIIGIGLHDCVLECGLRKHCGSLSYVRQIPICDLFMSSSQENLTNGNCIFISKSDIKVEKKPCGDCIYGQVCDIGTNSCKVKECTSPPNISKGKTIGIMRKQNSRVWFRCNAGYADVTTKFATCTEHGWSATATCAKISCGDPSIAHGTIAPENGTLYQDTATVVCEPGYYASVNTVKCTASGSWETATCERISCGPPIDVPDGYVIAVYGDLYLDTARVICPNSGKEIIITCSSSGKWVALACNPKDCYTAKNVLKYGGNLRITPTGRICEPWIIHSNFRKNNWGVELQCFPESSFEEAENFCRNPTFKDFNLWCFSSHPDTFEFCEIPAC